MFMFIKNVEGDHEKSLIPNIDLIPGIPLLGIWSGKFMFYT